MGDLTYNYTMFFTSSAAVDGVPTAWGIYHAVGGASKISAQNGEKLDELGQTLNELKVLVKGLGTRIDDMNSEIGNLRTELDLLKRGILTVRIRQEKSIMPSCKKALDVSRIIARRVVPDELEKLDKPKPVITIPLPKDPFSDAPELQ